MADQTLWCGEELPTGSILDFPHQIDRQGCAFTVGLDGLELLGGE